MVFVVVFAVVLVALDVLIMLDSVLSRTEDLAALDALVVGRDCFNVSRLGARYAGGKSSSRADANRLAVLETPNFSFSLSGLVTDTNLSIALLGILSFVAALLATALALMNFLGFLRDSS